MASLESLGLPGLFISAFISSTVAPGGSEVVLAYLVNQQVAPVIELITIATIGNTLGALTTCWLGAWTAKKYPSKQLESKQYERALRWISRWGVWTLLLSWLPLAGDALCFAAGWLKLSPIACVIAIMVGKLIRYAAVAYAFI